MLGFPSSVLATWNPTAGSVWRAYRPAYSRRTSPACGRLSAFSRRRAPRLNCPDVGTIPHVFVVADTAGGLDITKRFCYTSPTWRNASIAPLPARGTLPSRLSARPASAARAARYRARRRPPPSGQTLDGRDRGGAFASMSAAGAGFFVAAMRPGNSTAGAFARSEVRIVSSPGFALGNGPTRQKGVKNEEEAGRREI